MGNDRAGIPSKANRVGRFDTARLGKYERRLKIAWIFVVSRIGGASPCGHDRHRYLFMDMVLLSIAFMYRA